MINILQVCNILMKEVQGACYTIWLYVWMYVEINDNFNYVPFSCGIKLWYNVLYCGYVDKNCTRNEWHVMCIVKIISADEPIALVTGLSGVTRTQNSNSKYVYSTTFYKYSLYKL